MKIFSQSVLSIFFLTLFFLFSGCGNSAQNFYNDVEDIATNQEKVIQDVATLYTQVSGGEIEKSIYSERMAEKRLLLTELQDRSNRLKVPASGKAVAQTLDQWLKDSESVIILLQNTALIPSHDDSLVPVSLGEELQQLQSTMQTLSESSAMLMSEMQMFQMENGLGE